MSRTLDRMPTSSKLLVLGDVPTPGRNVPACLRAHPTNISACQRSRADSLAPGRYQAEQQAAATHGASFSSAADWVCTYDPCPVVMGNVNMWRDKSHLTATFSRMLAPTMRRLVSQALAE